MALSIEDIDRLAREIAGLEARRIEAARRKNLAQEEELELRRQIAERRDDVLDSLTSVVGRYMTTGESP